MPRRYRKLLLCGVPLLVLVCITSVVLITRASSEMTTATGKASRPPKVKDGLRNLSLQPEALRVSRPRCFLREGIAERGKQNRRDQ